MAKKKSLKKSKPKSPQPPSDHEVLRQYLSWRNHDRYNIGAILRSAESMMDALHGADGIDCVLLNLLMRFDDGVNDEAGFGTLHMLAVVLDAPELFWFAEGQEIAHFSSGGPPPRLKKKYYKYQANYDAGYQSHFTGRCDAWGEALIARSNATASAARLESAA